jgi:hypothetical protein
MLVLGAGGERMIRLAGVVLIILGLIAQPLMAAVPASMLAGGSQPQAIVDTADSDTAMMEHSAKVHAEAPCHESSADEATSAACDNCVLNCADGMCASTCSLNGAALVHQLFVLFDSPSATRVIDTSGALVEGLPSSIFHPPKHA